MFIEKHFELHFLINVKQNNVCFYSKFAYPECYMLRKTLGLLILGLEWKLCETLPWCDLSRLPGGRPWTGRSSWCVPWTGRSRLDRHRWSVRCLIPEKVIILFILEDVRIREMALTLKPVWIFNQLFFWLFLFYSMKFLSSFICLFVIQIIVC